ncbi:1275_t:CDS:2, partial [Racocetra persica]
LICVNDIPPLIAAVAPPILKLCAVKRPLIPVYSIICFTTAATAATDIPPPLFDKNKGLSSTNLLPVGSTGTNLPFAKGSFLAFLTLNHNNPIFVPHPSTSIHTTLPAYTSYKNLLTLKPNSYTTLSGPRSLEDYHAIVLMPPMGTDPEAIPNRGPELSTT